MATIKQQKPKVQTWIRNVENGNIKNKTERVLSAVYLATTKTLPGELDLFNSNLYLKTISTYELRNNLEFPHQTLTAILSVLQDEGLIKVVGECSVKNSVFSLWQYVFYNHERAALKEARVYEKYEAWIKRGREDFSELMPTDLFIEINKVEKNLIEWKINK
jgi:hypothetical protein